MPFSQVSKNRSTSSVRYDSTLPLVVTREIERKAGMRFPRHGLVLLWGQCRRTLGRGGWGAIIMFVLQVGKLRHRGEGNVLRVT